MGSSLEIHGDFIRLTTWSEMVGQRVLHQKLAIDNQMPTCSPSGGQWQTEHKSGIEQHILSNPVLVGLPPTKPQVGLLGALQQAACDGCWSSLHSSHSNVWVHHLSLRVFEVFWSLATLPYRDKIMWEDCSRNACKHPARHLNTNPKSPVSDQHGHHALANSSNILSVNANSCIQ